MTAAFMGPTLRRLALVSIVGRNSQTGPTRASPVERVVGWHEQRLAADGAHLATATLACPTCDVPVGLPPGAFPPSHGLACPYCETGGAVRDFLTFDTPARPARVEVRVRLRSPR